MEFKIKQIQFNTHEYFSALELRTEILRKPLGLEFNEEQLATEFRDFHFVAISDENQKVIGNLILTMLDNNSIKMRQVAISESYQNQGIGKKLVAKSESFAKNKNFKFIILHARASAIPFYLNLGYQKIGEEFLEVGIPHFKMYKQL